MYKEFFVDVSDLEAPEPFTKITQLLGKLEATSYIRAKHRMEPFPLYDLLKESNYEFFTLKVEESRYHILIWLAGNKEISDYCQNLKTIK